MTVQTFLIVPAVLAAGALSTGCNTLAGPIGEASCRVSARGECPELADRTFYIPESAGLIYFAPSGVTYQAEPTTIVRGKWRVDEAGDSIIRRMPSAGTLPPSPISYLTGRPSSEGDPARLSSNSEGFYVRVHDERSLREILEEAARR